MKFALLMFLTIVGHNLQAANQELRARMESFKGITGEFNPIPSQNGVNVQERKLAWPAIGLTSISFLRSPNLKDQDTRAKVCFFIPEFALNPTLEMSDSRSTELLLASASNWRKNAWNSIVLDFKSGIGTYGAGGALTFLVDDIHSKTELHPELKSMVGSSTFVQSPIRLVTVNETCEPTSQIQFIHTYNSNLFQLELYIFNSSDQSDEVLIQAQSLTSQAKGQIAANTNFSKTPDQRFQVADTKLRLKERKKIFPIIWSPTYSKTKPPETILFIYSP